MIFWKGGGSFPNLCRILFGSFLKIHTNNGKAEYEAGIVHCEEDIYSDKANLMFAKRRAWMVRL